MTVTWELPGYRIDELLGVGSTGEVWRAAAVLTGEPVALKRVRRVPGMARAAVDEAAILTALDHPHLLRLRATHHIDDDLVLVLDLAAGGALSTLLARRGRLCVGEVVTAIAPVGAAVAYAHGVGIVHGDISAANILFTAGGRPLLADLGVARLLGTTAPVHTTPDYVDPVVAAGGAPTPASDVFMLAAVALHALTGAPPWSGPEPRSVFLRAASGAAPDFGEWLATAGVPAQVRAVVERGLALEPGERGTAAEFALDLRHAAEPVAVELTAGRAAAPPAAGSTGGRVGSWPLEMRSGEVVPSELDRDGDGGNGLDGGGDDRSGDDFAPVVTPGGTPAPFGAVRLTAGVPVAPVPRPSPRHLAGPVRRIRPRGSRLRLALAVLAALVVGVVAWQCRPSGGAMSSAAPVQRRPLTPGPAVSGPSVSGPSVRSTGGPAAASRAGPPHPSDPGAVATLQRLDDLRSVAFARRDASLLARVYGSPVLLARDRALLLAIVPPGCGLRGVHTTFSAAAVTSRTADAVTVTARTRVSPSALVCHGTADAAALGSRPETVTIQLVRVAGDYRIGRLRVVRD